MSWQKPSAKKCPKCGNYMIEKGKREKEINQVLHRFEKAGMDLPEEVEQTRRFVLDLQGA